MKIRHVAIACILAVFIIASVPCLLYNSIKVQAADESVDTVSASDITETSATLNGNLTSLGTSANVAVSFEWGTTTAYGNVTTPQTITVTGQFIAVLTGLTPNTAYHFRAKGVGDDICYGQDKTFFTTTPGIPIIITNEATNITDTTARLNGNLTSLGVSDNITVRFQWGTSAGYGYLTSTQKMNETGKFSASLSELSPNTTYHFRSAAYGDGAGYGEDKTFTTKVSPVSFSVTTDVATGVTATEATLNGTLTDLGTVAKVNVSFEWGTTTSYGTETAPKTMNATGSFNNQISGLSPGTTYHFRAKAVAGEIAYGEDKTLTANSDPPSINTYSATNITDDSAILNGNMASLGTATSAETSFEWATEKGGPYPNETSPQAKNAAGNFSSSLTGLDPDTTYYFRAKAIGDGTSYGPEFSFKTEPETAMVPAIKDEDSVFGELNWPVIAGAAIGITLLIFLLVTLTRPRKTTAGATRPQEGFQQQTPGGQQAYKCPTCGVNIGFGTNHCINCGTALNWGTQQMSRCPVCGTTIAFGANPCPNCGTGLDWNM